MKDTFLYTDDSYPRAISGRGWYRALLTRPRFREICREIPIRRSDVVLEVGCDEGQLLRWVEAAGPSVYGIEVNRDAVRNAHHSRIQQGSAEHIPFPDNMFSICIASHVIEHLARPEQFLTEACRVLRHQGRLVLLYPWELFRGMTVLPDVIIRGRPLRLIREIHKHVMTPSTLRSLARTLPFIHRRSRVFLGFPYLGLQYITVLEKQ